MIVWWSIGALICSSSKAANRLKPTSFGINILPNQDRLWRRGRRKFGLTKIPSERPDHQRPSPVAAPFRRGGCCGRSQRVQLACRSCADHLLQCIACRVGPAISRALERLARTSKSAKAHELRSLLGGPTTGDKDNDCLR